MKNMMLRNFLYLDTDILNDYLSSMEGYLIEDSEIIENTKTQTQGKAGVKIAEATKSNDKEKGVLHKAVHTDAGKFQKLYTILDESGMIQFLEAFDPDIWKSIKRNELLEIPATLSVPRIYKTIHEVGNISPLMDLMSAFGESDLIDEGDMNAIKGLKSFDGMNKGKEIPILLNLETTNEYSFASKLSPKFLRCDLDKLEDEITIVGKVQKIIPDGEKYEVYSMISGMDTIMSTQNRKNRREYEKNKSSKDISDTINGPAMILIPLAIYR